MKSKMMNFDECLKWDAEHNYIRCFRKDHGYGKKYPLVMCPSIQFEPLPTYLFTSKKKYITSTNKWRATNENMSLL